MRGPVVVGGLRLRRVRLRFRRIGHGSQQPNPAAITGAGAAGGKGGSRKESVDSGAGGRIGGVKIGGVGGKPPAKLRPNFAGRSGTPRSGGGRPALKPGRLGGGPHGVTVHLRGDENGEARLRLGGRHGQLPSFEKFPAGRGSLGLVVEEETFDRGRRSRMGGEVKRRFLHNGRLVNCSVSILVARLCCRLQFFVVNIFLVYSNVRVEFSLLLWFLVVVTWVWNLGWGF